MIETLDPYHDTWAFVIRYGQARLVAPGDAPVFMLVGALAPRWFDALLMWMSGSVFVAASWLHQSQADVRPVVLFVALAVFLLQTMAGRATRSVLDWLLVRK